MWRNYLSIVFVSFLFLLSFFFFVPKEKEYKITSVISPVNFKFDDEAFIIEDLETFDSYFSGKNKEISIKLNISETEAFILGNLAKQWAEKLMIGRKVHIKNKNDLIFYKYSYRKKFLYSGFCLKNFNPYFEEAFELKLNEIRNSTYKVLDLDTDIIYNIEDSKALGLKNFIIIKNFNQSKFVKKDLFFKPLFDNGNVKLYYTDLMSKLNPDRNCSTEICQEILMNINNSKNTIDMAIYGYSSVPIIEDAIKEAINRGVKIRLIYDVDAFGKNIYPNTNKLVKLISKNKNDGFSKESKNIMHNKFYIFDNKVLITGSANLSHMDMSGFNSNSILVTDSKKIVQMYKNEFEQMYYGKFHNDKQSFKNQKVLLGDMELEIYFSPQDKGIANAIIPIIKNAKSYIYIPTFVLTEKRVTEELIKAKNRGVDVKIILDALNASIKHSKHQELRNNGVLVKTENYAGKMHSKSMIVDDLYTIIGSMNFSYSGENKNDENFIVIKDSKIAREYKSFFLHQWENINNKWLYLNAHAEGKDSIGSCHDGIDNDYDGYVDLDDISCK